MNGERILVLDDESAVRQTLSDILEDAGFSPIPASTIAEATAIVESVAVDLAVVDICLSDGNGLDFAIRRREQNNDTVWFILTGAADIENVIGAVRGGIHGFFRKPVDPGDLVERVRTELAALRHRRALQRSSRRLDFILEHSPALVYSRDPTDPDRFTFVGPTVQQLIGVSQEQLLTGAVSWSDLIHPGDKLAVNEIDCSRTADASAVEYRVRHSNGTWVWIRDSRQRISSADGEIVEVVGAMLDVTDRRRTEDELSLYLMAADKSGEALVIADSDKHITHVNAAVGMLYGYESDELIGAHVRLLDSGLNPAETLEELDNAIDRGSSWTGRLVSRRKDGSTFPTEATVAVVGDVPDHQHLVAMIHDISDLEAAHRLVDTVRSEYHHLLSHELNNLLAPLVGLAGLVADRIEGVADKRLVSAARSVSGNARAAADFVEKLKQVQAIELGTRPVTLRRADFVSMVKSTIRDLSSLAKPHGVSIKLVPDCQECGCYFDLDLLPRVVENLIRNAIEHVRFEGDPADRRVVVDLGCGEDTVVLRVWNRGAPIPPNQLDHFFDPFNTDRRTKKTGMGLGTTYAKLVIEAHGGTIGVDSSAVNGTCVWFGIPLRSEKVDGVP
jgi:PAS domain S-box-containing protein